MSGPVRSLDLAELRAFCAAVDLGSLGRASRLLRVSQPALSKRMRTIEAVVGTRLVERSPRGISPTPAGTKLEVDEFIATPMVVRDPSANTRRVVEEALAERGLSLTAPLAEVGSTSAAKATALTEGAPVLLSRMAVGPADPGLVVRRVRDIPFPRQFVMVAGAEE